MFHTHHRTSAPRCGVGALALAAVLFAIPATVRATELIPSIGMTKSTDENAGNAKLFGGVALRVPLLPFLQGEGQIQYREDSQIGGALTVRQWPVTASAWLKPGIPLYAGGGLGWYHTTYHFPDTFPLKDTTTDKLGLHLGGGLDLPVSPHLGVDVNGRYIWMQQNRNDPEFPRSFNPDFWTAGVGLAFKF